jgi:hypothetical protein
MPPKVFYSMVENGKLEMEKKDEKNLWYFVYEKGFK